MVGPRGALDAPTRPVAARETIRDRWFGGPIVATDLRRSRAAVRLAGCPYREGDYLWMFQPAFVDDAGHVGYPFYLGEFDGKLYVDGELAGRRRRPDLDADVRAPERHQYELVYATHRENGFWQRSKDVETRWRFASERPAATTSRCR